MTQYSKALYSDCQRRRGFGTLHPHRFWQPVSLVVKQQGHLSRAAIHVVGYDR
jgi:hypothetical protein